MNVVGLDLSLTATGVAFGGLAARISTKKDGCERLAAVRERVLEFLTPLPDLVGIEGYSFNSKYGGERLGELGGVIRLQLWELGIPFVEIPPASVKKYATGSGTASKDEVLGAAIRRLGYERDDHNEADALWVRAMAYDHYGAPIVEVPASHRAALTAIVKKKGKPDRPAILWPELRVAA